MIKEIFMEFWWLCKEMSPTLKLAARVAVALLVITETAPLIYTAYFDLALLKLPEAEPWILGDLAAIFTVFSYVIAYGLFEMINVAFEDSGGKYDVEKAKAQSKAQDQTSDKNLSEA